MNKTIFYLLIFLLVQMFLSVTYAAVHVSGGGCAYVTGVRSVGFTDALGNSKLRVTLDLSGPYFSEFDCSGGVVDRQTVSSVKFDNLALREDLNRTIQLDGKIADYIKFEEGNDTLKISFFSNENILSAASVSVLPRSKTEPWRMMIDCPSRSACDIRKSAPGISGKCIVLDPGHGGSDTGAIGPGGVCEKDVNLSIATLLKEMLAGAGARVVMTRDRDVDCAYPKCSDEEELSARVAYARKYNPDIFISLHNDAYYKRSSNGTATYYYSKTVQDEKLAKAIQRDLQSSVGLANKGTRKANFYVLRNTKMPAALVEVAFISNVAEEKLLNTPGFQQKAAQGIFDGIGDYFSGR